MVLFIILGVVVFLTLAVLGILFFMLGKEQKRKDAVPMTDMEQLKRELSNQTFEQKGSIEKNSEIIPLFEATTGLPLGPTQLAEPSPEDEAYRLRAQKLEDELLEISKKAAGQSTEANEMLIKLTEENESLKTKVVEVEQAQQRLKELEVETSGLKAENVNLQSELESSGSRVRQLEQEMTAIKLQMGEEISHANETVAQLTKEMESLPETKSEEINPAVQQELEAVKNELLEAKRKYQDLETSVNELKSSNALLTEKNEQLQYEMVKARAQSSGLERISFNYKNQIEDFLKKVSAAQEENSHLVEAKNRLEGMVTEIKSENEDLAHKDQLARFELEKNRSRLDTLERECEELKMRIQQKDHP